MSVVTEEGQHEIFEPRNKTPEEMTAEFQTQLRELGDSPVELADRMQKLGDDRPYNTILRGIQRMLSGETRVSGEMKALVTMMLRQQRKLKKRHANLTWNQLPDGAYSTQMDDFGITLAPQSRNRWLVNLRHKDGLSPPWPRWQDSLEAAKHKALICVEDATDYLIELEIERAAEKHGDA